jgi:aminoglycoside phosphotransferase (APT) family kinase protein
LGNPILCSHGDIAPWNVITNGNRIAGLIDWETAGPIDPMIELARICWLFPQLVDDDLGKLYELPPPKKRAEQVRLIIDTYGLNKKVYCLSRTCRFSGKHIRWFKAWRSEPASSFVC